MTASEPILRTADMRTFFIIAVATKLLTGSPAAAQSGTEAFVQTIGRDTISLEQYTRSGNTITGRWLTTYGSMTMHDYVLTLRPDGTVEHLKLSVFLVRGGVLGDNDITFGRDSATVVIKRDSVITRRVAAADAFPILGQTIAMWEAITRHQRAAKQDSALVTLMESFGGQLARAPAVFIGRDSANLAGWRFALDAEGGVMGGGARLSPVAQRRIQRVASVDIPGALKSFPDLPVNVPAGSVNYFRRDTTKATVGAVSLIVDYSRPYTSGRDVFKRGILGDTLWRTGAFAATQFTTSADLLIAGKVLPAGTYSLWTRASPDNRTYQLVFNSQVQQWGTEHDFARDVLTVPLTRTPLASAVDPFLIAIEASGGGGGVLKLQWGTTELSTPFTAR